MENTQRILWSIIQACDRLEKMDDAEAQAELHDIAVVLDVVDTRAWEFVDEITRKRLRDKKGA